MESTKYKTVEEYLAAAPKNLTLVLEELRRAIKEEAPQAEEVISYNMPAFKMKKVLVYYAAQKNHIGFYPTASPIIAFEKELKPYKTSKGAIQFPIGEPIPINLVKRIVQYRVKQVLEKEKAKVKGK